jgi:hypothetical protein
MKFLFLRQLRNWVTGINVIQARFDILQSKLDSILISHENAAASAKNFEEVVQENPSIEKNESLAGRQVTSNLTNYSSSIFDVLNSLEKSCGNIFTGNELTPSQDVYFDREDISIVMPIYNHENTIAEAIESVLMQEMPYTSIIYCLNDASTDKSADILNDYSKRFPGRIKVYTNPQNLGSGKSSIIYQEPPIFGRYWCILEGDDYWSAKDKLAKQISFLDANSEFIGCSGNTVVKNEMTGEERIIKPDRNTWNLLDLILLRQKYAFYVHTSSIIWRNIYIHQGSFLPPSFREAAGIGDLFLMHMMLCMGGKMQNIPEIMSCYRVTGRGLWTSKSPEEQAELNMILLKNIDRSIPDKYKVLSRYHKIKSLIPGPVN